ncbi:hypothetical protein SCHPADRAFT_892471 [Schizopora paradoxa]|uniref:Uncharacterized protein n=1 Tax=Schizopora paradoxa TaxID=27342 RepID=A0A0H2RLD3_9AGAM|nr:hypothetical protein SCHPADRAFT_892471 [Schizopora paradoxa]
MSRFWFDASTFSFVDSNTSDVRLWLARGCTFATQPLPATHRLARAAISSPPTRRRERVPRCASQPLKSCEARKPSRRQQDDSRRLLPPSLRRCSTTLWPRLRKLHSLAGVFFLLFRTWRFEDQVDARSWEGSLQFATETLTAEVVGASILFKRLELHLILSQSYRLAERFLHLHLRHIALLSFIVLLNSSKSSLLVKLVSHSQPVRTSVARPSLPLLLSTKRGEALSQAVDVDVIGDISRSTLNTAHVLAVHRLSPFAHLSIVVVWRSWGPVGGRKSREDQLAETRFGYDLLRIASERRHCATLTACSSSSSTVVIVKNPVTCRDAASSVKTERPRSHIPHPASRLLPVFGGDVLPDLERMDWIEELLGVGSWNEMDGVCGRGGGREGRVDVWLRNRTDVTSTLALGSYLICSILVLVLCRFGRRRMDGRANDRTAEESEEEGDEGRRMRRRRSSWHGYSGLGRSVTEEVQWRIAAYSIERRGGCQSRGPPSSRRIYQEFPFFLHDLLWTAVNDSRNAACWTLARRHASRSRNADAASYVIVIVGLADVQLHRVA